MIVLSHRGYWQEPLEKNQLASFDKKYTVNVVFKYFKRGL